MSSASRRQSKLDPLQAARPSPVQSANPAPLGEHRQFAIRNIVQMALKNKERKGIVDLHKRPFGEHTICSRTSFIAKALVPTDAINPLTPAAYHTPNNRDLIHGHRDDRAQSEDRERQYKPNEIRRLVQRKHPDEKRYHAAVKQVDTERQPGQCANGSLSARGGQQRDVLPPHALEKHEQRS